MTGDSVRSDAAPTAAMAAVAAELRALGERLIALAECVEADPAAAQEPLAREAYRLRRLNQEVAVGWPNGGWRRFPPLHPRHAAGVVDSPGARRRSARDAAATPPHPITRCGHRTPGGGGYAPARTAPGPDYSRPGEVALHGAAGRTRRLATRRVTEPQPLANAARSTPRQ